MNTDIRIESFGQKIKMGIKYFIDNLKIILLNLNIKNGKLTRIRRKKPFHFISVYRCSFRHSLLANLRLRTVFFLSLLLCNAPLLAREITFLPAYVLGEEPPALKKKDNISTGVAELIAYYANENFVLDISDPDKVKTYISESGEELDTKPSKSLLNGICEEFSSDFIVRTEINFEGSISILSEVYNCRGKVIASNESLFKDNFYLAMEKHTKKTLSFLVPKNKTSLKIDYIAEEEIVFLFDLSGSISREIKSTVNYINSITGTKNLSIGAILVSENSIKVIKPAFNHNKLKEELGRIKQGGEVGLDRISQGLVKARSELGISKLLKKKLILITDAKSDGSMDYGYISAVQTMKEIGYKVFIVTGSFFDYKSMNLHKKAAKAGGNNLQQIMHYQKVGTAKGYRTIYLHDRIIYFDESAQVDLKELDLKELGMLDEGSVLGKVDFPHPDNMSEVYEKVQGQRLLEKHRIQSNIQNVVEKIVQSKPGTLNFKGSKVLVKTGSVSFWLDLSSFDQSLENKQVSFRASFIKDEFSANGFANIPSETVVYKENIPKLLVLEPAQIRNFLKSNSSFTCFISGKVLEVK